MGLIHAAIQLNGYLIDWTRLTDLVSIRPIKSRRAILAADLEQGLLYKGSSKERVEDILRKLAERIVHWNVHCTFNFLKRNCQVFVMDCLHALGIEYKFSAGISEYFSWLCRKGYSPVKKFINPIDSQVIRFSSHQQLDEFVKLLEETEPYFREKYPDAWDLLKAYDRGYWIGLVNVDKEKQKVSPLFSFRLYLKY